MRRAAGTALVIASLAALPPTAATAAPTPIRVTVIGDSVVAAVFAWGNARSILGKGIDLQMQVAVCRRLTGESCPFGGSEPSNLVDLVSALGPTLGKTVVVGVGYNDFEQTFAQSVEDSVQALLQAGVTRVFWVTLREVRQPYVNMNDVLVAASKQHPQMTLVDWNVFSRAQPGWFQTDGIHLQGSGAVAMATQLHAALVQSLAPVIAASTPLATGHVGRPYVVRMVVGGGTAPYRWSVVSGSLPSGLRIRTDGRIIGRPTKPARDRLVVGVEDAHGFTATLSMLLVIEAIPAGLNTASNR
jgi:hypothetical protein